MQKSVKWLSVVLLSAAAAVLLVIGGRNLWQRFGGDQVRLNEVPFGANGDRVLPKGRDADFMASMEMLDELNLRLYERSAEYRQQGNLDQALATLATIRKNLPGFLPAYHEAAVIRYNRWERSAGDSAVAGLLLEKALEIDPGHPAIRHGYGLLLLRAGDSTAAAQQFQLALDVAPQFPDPRIRLARYHLERDEPAQAEEHIRLAISLLDGRGEAPYDLMAWLLYKQGQDEDAQIAVDLARTEGQESEMLEFVRGLLMEARGDIKSADAIFRGLLQKHPSDTRYGWALRTLGVKPPRVEVEVQKAPVSPAIQAGAEGGISVLAPLVDRYPENGPLWYALGQFHALHGDFPKALEAYDSALKHQPDIPGLNEARGRALQSKSHESRGISAKALVDRMLADTAILGGRFGQDNQDVVIPVASGMLGTYPIAWGTYREAVLADHQGRFSRTTKGNLLDIRFEGGLRQEHLLAFREDRFWGVRVIVTDTSETPIDVLGRVLSQKTRISGEGKGTGLAKCEGYKPLQGVIWENEDTFEFLAQFEGSENEVRLVRMAIDSLPDDRRLCNLVTFLDTEHWE